MVDTPPTGDANLVEFLSARARTASDGRLALDAGVGFVVAIMAVIWRPPSWHLVVCIGLCFAAFGAWGIADRELRERTSASADPRMSLSLLRLSRFLAVAIGALAAGALVISLLGVMLGTWIS